MKYRVSDQYELILKEVKTKKAKIKKKKRKIIFTWWRIDDCANEHQHNEMYGTNVLSTWYLIVRNFKKKSKGYEQNN